jgi:hypothetical protein
MHSQAFRADLNVLIVLEDVISAGREFHDSGAATEKLLSPYLVFERGTMRCSEQDDLVRRSLVC